MEKLKIYSAYLPYKTYVKNDFSRIYELSTYSNMRSNEIERRDIQSVINGNFKLILFSLEDLTREITIGGETFVPLHKILEEYCFNLKVMSKEEILSYQESLLEIDISYKVHSLLLKWKFNVINLPETEYIKVTEENNPYD